MKIMKKYIAWRKWSNDTEKYEKIFIRRNDIIVCLKMTENGIEKMWYEETVS